MHGHVIKSVFLILTSDDYESDGTIAIATIAFTNMMLCLIDQLPHSLSNKPSITESLLGAWLRW